MTVKNVIRLSFLLRLLFGAILVAIAVQYFVFGIGVFNTSEAVNAIVAIVAALFGARDLLRAYKTAVVYLNADFDDDGSLTNGNGIPQYGYRDQWERENL